MNNVRIVLMQTFHPGNIGATARAMMNMGIRDLVLVRPRLFPDAEATARAGTAQIILDKARVVETLEDAIADCGWVIGTSARGREFKLPQGTPREYAPRIVTESREHPVAIVFGRERMGLSNEEIMRCHAHMMIPSHPDHPVLNIAQAIQVICYEIYQSVLIDAGRSEGKEPDHEAAESYPNDATLNRFYDTLETALTEAGFINPAQPGRTMDRLKTVYKRARPTQKELNALFGALNALRQPGE